MITVSTEILFHFSCDRCGKWWSVGDWNPQPKMYCPHCGTTQEIWVPKLKDPRPLTESEIDMFLHGGGQ